MKLRPKYHKTHSFAYIRLWDERGLVCCRLRKMPIDSFHSYLFCLSCFVSAETIQCGMFIFFWCQQRSQDNRHNIQQRPIEAERERKKETKIEWLIWLTLLSQCFDAWVVRLNWQVFWCSHSQFANWKCALLYRGKNALENWVEQKGYLEMASDMSFTIFFLHNDFDLNLKFTNETNAH